jgi:hypothetical protein
VRKRSTHRCYFPDEEDEEAAGGVWTPTVEPTEVETGEVEDPDEDDAELVPLPPEDGEDTTVLPATTGTKGLRAAICAGTGTLTGVARVLGTDTKGAGAVVVLTVVVEEDLCRTLIPKKAPRRTTTPTPPKMSAR